MEPLTTDQHGKISEALLRKNAQLEYANLEYQVRLTDALEEVQQLRGRPVEGEVSGDASP